VVRVNKVARRAAPRACAAASSTAHAAAGPCAARAAASRLTCEFAIVGSADTRIAATAQ